MVVAWNTSHIFSSCEFMPKLPATSVHPVLLTPVVLPSSACHGFNKTNQTKSSLHRTAHESWKKNEGCLRTPSQQQAPIVIKLCLAVPGNPQCCHPGKCHWIGWSRGWSSRCPSLRYETSWKLCVTSCCLEAKVWLSRDPGYVNSIHSIYSHALQLCTGLANVPPMQFRIIYTKTSTRPFLHRPHPKPFRDHARTAAAQTRLNFKHRTLTFSWFFLHLCRLSFIFVYLLLQLD